jgi:hypothetical protein
MKRQVKITKAPLPKAQQGLYTKEKLTNNGFQFPVNFKEGMAPGFDVKKNLGPVDRDKANIEAEKGETIITPMGDDAWTKSLPKTYIIGGKRHSKGGTPLNVPEGSFIFSDYLKEKNPDVHKLLNRPVKKGGYTYADLSKPFMLNADIQLMLDPDSDHITRDTAQLNIQNKVDKLGMISLLQESTKGFTDDEGNTDIPSVGVPYLEKSGIDLEKAIDPFLQAIKQPVQEQQQPQGMSPDMMPQMGGMPQQGMPPMEQGMPPMDGAIPMGRKGGQILVMKKGGSVKKFQDGGSYKSIVDSTNSMFADFAKEAQSDMYKTGGDIKEYQTAGTTTSAGALRQGEIVKMNPQTGKFEIYNAEGKLVGYVNPSEQQLNINRSANIPANAVVLDRSKFATEAEYMIAKQKAFADAGGKPVVVVNPDGTIKQLSKKNVNLTYEGEDLKTTFNGRTELAAQYSYLEKQFNNPKVKEELKKRALAALDVPKNVRGMEPAEIAALKQKLQDPEYAYQQFMDMQKRNYATYAHSFGEGRKQIKDRANDPDGTSAAANKDFEDEWKRIGLKAPDRATAAAQQAIYIGYQNLIDDKQANKITDPEVMNAIAPFKVGQVGKTDDAIMGEGAAGQISAVDGIYTNTTTGQLAMLDNPTEIGEGDLPGSEGVMKPGKKPQYKSGDVRKGWTAPDIWNFWGAAQEVYRDQPQQPFNAMPNVYLPNVGLLSPDDMQAQIRGTLQGQGDIVNAYAGPQAAIAAMSNMSGADQVASQTAQVHNQNIQIINQHELNKSQILNQASQNAATLTTNLSDKWAQLKDNMQARKSAALAEVRKAFAQGESNEGAFQAMNLNTPNYQWDPFSQDYYGFIPGSDIEPTYSNKQTARGLFEEYRDAMPGVSDNAITQLVKADMGIKDTPDYLNYSSGIPG